MRQWCWVLMGVGVMVQGSATAQDWSGPFTLAPVSAPDLVLEAVDAGAVAGTKVSIGQPNGKEHQKWLLSAAGDGWYRLKPAHADHLALSAADGGKTNGTLLVLAPVSDDPWQLWSIKQNLDGAFTLIPKHAPGMGLDDFGGGSVPGARQDLWEYHPGDEHLEWRLKPLAGATWPAAVGDLNKPAPAKGVIKEFTFESSKIFPGTKRTGTVFIPAQYDGTKPACVYVKQDGYNPREKTMLETLIAAGDMPVTVGIFIRPGDLPAPMNGTLGRRNRCLEYDGVGDEYVRFLLDELLPYVAKTFDLKLSNSGNDRCIAGGSSGGIAAFNAAWHRPDAFSRVYANSGSFVAFRGGHEFPTLIRKTEAKPIRAYLTTGTHDMENCAGDWCLIDQEMDKALKFAGYDYQFTLIDGPHVAGWNEHWMPAMRFLWKGWPEPVKAGPSGPRVRDILGENAAPWELVADNLRDARSPACNSKGEVFFLAAGAIQRLSLDGKIFPYLADAGGATGLAVGAHDELFTVSTTTGRVMRYNGTGAGKLLCEGLPGRYVLARPDGSLYVTSGGEVWRVSGGQKTRVDTGLKAATGLASRPDQWILSVADGASKWVYSYQVAADGTLINKERFSWLHVPDWEDDAGAESVCYAREGQMLVATRLGIQACADDGPTQVIIPLPDNARATGVCLGGAQLDTLFVTDGARLWRRKVRIHAVGAFSPWQKMPGSPL